MQRERAGDPRVLALVLARAGSKGLPRKNALPVAGRSMLAWTLEHALGSRRVSRVAVSTDGEELAAIAEGLGVAVVRRPEELANDTAPVDAAARHAVEHLEAAGERFAAVAILYGNVPVRPADLTDRAVEKLLTTGCDSVQSVCGTGKAHPYWMKRLVASEAGAGAGADADVIEPYVENAVYRRQDLPPLYLLDGGVLAVRRASLFTVREGGAGEPHAFLGRDRRAVVTRAGEVVDVDDEIDLRVAEAVLRASSATRSPIA